MESILNARRIEKTIRSTSPRRGVRREYLHIIISPNLDGIVIYSKGKPAKLGGTEVYYILISAKEAE